jgi:GTP pyrophosphokinase
MVVFSDIIYNYLKREGKVLGERFETAFLYAARLHAHQRRKATGTPYLAHLLSVAALVIEDGGDEDQAIAALLHDAIEDQGGDVIRQEIRRRFGERVGEIVEGLTDADTIPKPPWRERKDAYLQSLAHASPEVLRVSAADKLHNVRTILVDYRTYGEDLWRRFNGGKEGTLWYYRQVTDRLKERKNGKLVEELERAVAELEAMVLGLGEAHS